MMFFYLWTISSTTGNLLLSASSSFSLLSECETFYLMLTNLFFFLLFIFLDDILEVNEGILLFWHASSMLELALLIFDPKDLTFFILETFESISPESMWVKLYCLSLSFFLYILMINSQPNFISWAIRTVEYALEGSFLEYWLIFLKVSVRILNKGCLHIFIPTSPTLYEFLFKLKTYLNYESRA